MKFLTIYKADERLTKRNESGAPPDPAEMAGMNALIQKMTADGTLVSTEGCKQSSKGARVRLRDGKATVTDGPFTESKELIAGFAIIKARSKAEAIELTKRFLDIAGPGEVEIREIYGESDFAPPR